MKRAALGTLVVFIFFLSCGSVGAITPASPLEAKKKFRILVLGPGLSAKNDGSLTAAQMLESRLNRKCRECFEVIDGSREGYFSPDYLFYFRKAGPELNPDLVVYYESGVFLSAEVLSNFHYRIDDDQTQVIKKNAAEIEEDVCCSTFLKLFSDERRKKTNLVLRFVELFRMAKKVNAQDLYTILDMTIHTFDEMSALSNGKFLMLLAPSGYKPDGIIFSDDILQELLFKFLVHFYAPGKVSLAKAFHRQGFDVKVEDAFDQLYQPAYLMHRHPYALNTTGADLWSKIAARKIRAYLKENGREPLESK